MNENQLLTIDELAEKLKVSVSWLYRQNSLKVPDKIPMLKLGKFVRYEYDRVLEWIRERNKTKD